MRKPAILAKAKAKAHNLRLWWNKEGALAASLLLGLSLIILALSLP